jgi:hypothetical protein
MYVLATVCAYGFGVIYCAVEISSTQDKNADGKLIKREQLYRSFSALTTFNEWSTRGS